MLDTRTMLTGVSQEVHKMAKYNALNAVRQGVLPPSMDFDDAYQECLIFMYEHSDKPKAYIEKSLYFHLIRCTEKLRVAPSSSMRSYYKKAGRSFEYGEYSLEVIAGDGDCNEWLKCPEEEERDVTVFNFTAEEAIAVINDCRRQIKQGDENGISFATTRGKWHVEVSICRRKQFVGQFLLLDEAKAAKQKFLNDFMEAVFDALEEGN